MITPQKSAGGGENQWGDGNFDFILVSAEATMGKVYGTEEAIPQINLGWEDDDGDGFEEKFINIPKGLGLNDKSKLIERIAAVLGKSAKALFEEEPVLLQYDFGPGINNYDELFKALAGGRKIKVGITYNGQSIFGRRCALQIETSEKGWPKVRASMPQPTQPVKKQKQQAAQAPF